ncbi:peroxidasin homolog [Stylophora pistillata]|uniref:peroxidasin homolog n=1 Tax=Stylophora pistillata TaxID=50429 RepID=UPI000C03F74A|nr:peroxidasin homolog [Stylophora pistillata]
MKETEKADKQRNKRRTLDRLYSGSDLLLSLLCFIALIHHELRIQENHSLILDSSEFFKKMESEILRKVQQNDMGWRNKDKEPGSTSRTTQDGKEANPKRQKRSSPGNSQQNSTITYSDVQMLVKRELRLLQKQVCAKDHTLCRPGPKGSQGRRGKPGKPGPHGLTGKHGPVGAQGAKGMKGDVGKPGDLGPKGPSGPPGVKGTKGERGQSLSAPSLLKRPVGKTVNETQTATLKCTVNGNPEPSVTWYKINSSLPVGRHVVESSGALIVKDVKAEDDGVYTCKAQSLLGQVNASVKLTVQFAPKIPVTSKNVIAEEETNVTIQCTTSGRPRPIFKWSKSVGSLPKYRITFKNGTLKIFNLTRQDGGTYICKVANILGSAADTAQLTVFSPLRFKVRPPPELTPIIRSSVRLPCMAESGMRPFITWTKDGESFLPAGSNVLQNGTLVINSIKKSHEGSYTCRAANALTAIETKVKINNPLNITSCSAIRKYVSNTSRDYVIDTDGEGPLAPFTAYCDMSDKNGVGVTVISHDSESRTHVNGHEPHGSYSRDIHYTGASFSQLASLTRVSSHCEQFIKYECHGALLLKERHSWWVSRDSRNMTYWGGASPDSDKCACGMTKSCADPSIGCNCDMNDDVWREDSGLLTEKKDLPVKQLRFGDTGSDSLEEGYHTLGKLKCYGTP